MKAVREQIHAGSDLIKIMATGGVMTPGVNPEDAHYSAEEMKAGISEAHRFHKCCASHAQGALGILNAVRGGIDSIEHGIFMTDECIKEMKERGVWLVPTLAAVKNILKGYDDGDRSIPDYVIEKARRVFDRHIASIKMYYKAGGRIAMGTDAGTPHNRHGENARELEFMCEIGISTRDSLFFSTASAADLMRLVRPGPHQGRQLGRLRAVRRRSAGRHQARRAQGEPSPGGEARPGRQGPARRLRAAGPAGRGGVARETSPGAEAPVERVFLILFGIVWAIGTPIVALVALVRTSSLRDENCAAWRPSSPRCAGRSEQGVAARCRAACRRPRRPAPEPPRRARRVEAGGPAAAVRCPAPPVEAVPAPPAPAWQPPAPQPADIGWEQRLGARAFIWVGAITLALAAIFLVRYSIEEGYLSPEVRVILAALFGFALIGGAEKMQVARRARGAGAWPPPAWRRSTARCSRPSRSTT